MYKNVNQMCNGEENISQHLQDEQVWIVLAFFVIGLEQNGYSCFEAINVTTIF